MTVPSRSLAGAAWLLLAALGLQSSPLRADEPWQGLPPTPALPAGTVGHYAAIRGARIWYAQWGPQRHGVPVLLVHGGFGNSNYFGNLVPVLLEKGYRVIAMDSRGHGRSTRTDGPQTYEQMAADVVALLDSLDIPRVNLVGWSDGGIIGLEIALAHPNRLAGLFAFGANSVISGEIDDGDKNPVFAAYIARTRAEHRKLSPRPQQLAGFEAAMDAMWGSEPNITAEQLRSIAVPTTIADGEHDEVIKPEHTRYLAESIPGARLVILPNVSHFAMLQNPSLFDAAVVAFLEQH